MSALTDFYNVKGTDGAGRLITGVWEFSLDERETVHDYIQWLFPLTEPSQFNPDAPLLTADDIENIRDTFVLYSYRKMLAFYGLQEVLYPAGSFVIKIEVEEFGDSEGFAHLQRIVGRDALVPLLGPNVNHLFEKRKKVWLTSGNHNFLRITRILKCLKLFGLHGQAVAFRDALTEIYLQHAHIIGPETYEFWYDASDG